MPPGCDKLAIFAGILIAVPIPEEFQLKGEVIERAIHEAVIQAE